MIEFWRQVGIIVWKDITAELRDKEVLSAMAVFALIVLVIFSFTFDAGRITSARSLNVQRTALVRAVAPGVLWVTITFTGMLGLNRSFVQEKDRGCLDGLLLCPVDRGAIYLGKMLGIFLFISAVEGIAVPLYVIFFDLPFPPALLLVITLGTLGFVAAGTLFSAMAVHTRAREVMLPILLFPVLIPLLIATVKVTGGLLDGLVLSELNPWPQFIVGFDVIMLTVSYVTFDFVVEE